MLWFAVNTVFLAQLYTIFSTLAGGTPQWYPTAKSYSIIT